jgi:D-alanyl-D-alanine dipeptidase
MEDSQALAFENRVGVLGAVDLDGLTPSTAMALARFQRLVTAAGGAIAVTSAYRPATYQEHLRNVWEKWMGELRFNRDPLCQELRWQVEDEFRRHALLESQRPVVDSDHTRGLSFDAAVRLPGRKKGRRGRVSVDLLARRAGVLRPDIRRDPVHFKLMM